MVDPGVVAAKLAELAGRMVRVRARCPPTAAELMHDQDALEIIAFNLMLSVQACLDIASHVIADEGWPPATSLAQAFGRLHEHGLLSRETADALGRAAGLRNVLAHGYAGVNVELVHAAAREGIEDLDRFAREVAAWTGARGSGTERGGG
ncbi:MAG: DUF86 domain-containing protein [Deltaproteobacteria bacterium]|nr:DUF86 domain-containing protein [Deltaproteobacteria bacterium]